MNRFYVYALLDKSKPGKFEYGDISFEYEPFYIGKGTGDRIYHTMFDKNNTFKKNKITSLKRDGFDVISVKVFDNLYEHDSFIFESNLIKNIGRRDLNLGPLTNLTDGGDGRINVIVTEETKHKLREIGKKNADIRKILGTDKHTPEMVEHLRKINQGENNPFYGKSHSDSVKEDQSLRVSGINHPMFGKKHDDETLKKIRERRRECVDQEKLNKLSSERNSKSVLQFSIDGDFISEFSSIKVASQKTGCSESIIGKCCRGVIKSPRKFIFRFKDEESYRLDNSYDIKIGDEFRIYDVVYRLVKRNKSSVVAENSGGIFTFRKKDHLFLFDKKVILNT